MDSVSGVRCLVTGTVLSAVIAMTLLAGGLSGGSAYRGGLPIEVDGAIVGAIGVSGGTVQNDIDCAEAGLAVIKR